MTEFVYPVSDVVASPGATPWQTVGPFFHYALPYDGGPLVAGPDRPGGVTVLGRVFDGNGAPVADALLEVWQADEQGRFVTEPGIYVPPEATGFRGFGRCATDSDGRFAFRTVKPAAVPTADGRAQAPHVALSVFARGMLRRAVTRIYFDDEPANSDDPLLAAVEPDRRHTLVAARTEEGYLFDVRIQGDDETVFLDVGPR